MSNARLLVIAFAIAAVAALYTYVAQSFGLVSWISFTCWAAYFLAGGSPKEGWRMFVNWACGVGLGAIIILLATAIGPVLGATHAYPVAMFIVLVPTLLLATGVSTFILLIRALFVLADLFISHDVPALTGGRLLLLVLASAGMALETQAALLSDMLSVYSAHAPAEAKRRLCVDMDAAVGKHDGHAQDVFPHGAVTYGVGA